MNPGRRATPDSEAVGSSEDERPWPSSTSFGQMPIRENSMPGLPGGIWAQKRGSFKMSEQAKRNTLHDVRLNTGNAVQSALRAGNTPSPASDRAGALPFSIPLQPVPKTGRSLSHSQGQREIPISSSNLHAMQSANQAVATAPLALLAEEADTDSESETGSKLTHTTSHPPIGSLLRTTTLPVGFESFQGRSNGRPQPDSFSPPPSNMADRRLEASFAGLALDNQPRRSQWQSSLGWDDVRNVNESRRHSLAELPTRRGSLVGGEPGLFGKNFAEVFESDDGLHNMTGSTSFAAFSPDRTNTTAGDQLGAVHSQHSSFEIPQNYRVPQIDLNERERSEMNGFRDQQTNNTMQQWGSTGPTNNNRPRKQLYVVSFKCSRVDVFYLLEGTGLTVREGDLVIVEADRGQDLGTVQHANISPEMARVFKKKYSEEQYKWLMMYSHNKEGASNPNAELQRDNTDRPYYAADAPATLQGGPNFPRDNIANLKPKAIKRLAQNHEIKMLAEKEGNEAKAKRTCQQKVAHLRLQMEILDAEWQWDFQKLIFYYYADHYINFKDLITELYRIYKTRIWLSAINPASFSQHAINQPPSGIGPGAVTPYNPYGLNNSYTMAYGEDRDPYGAQMPYRIGYDTYTPNFPAIPGVPNSFAPGTNPYSIGFNPADVNAPAAASAQLPSQPPPGVVVSQSSQAAFAQRAGYGYPGHYAAQGAQQQGRNMDPSSYMAPFMPQGDAARPNYSFGPHTTPGNARGTNWERTIRNPGGGRESAFPQPIGTRQPLHGDEYTAATTLGPMANQMSSLVGPGPNATNHPNAAQRYTGSMPSHTGGRAE